jgi:putative membrane protein
VKSSFAAAAGIAAIALVANAAAALAAPPKAFLTDAIEGDNAEIQLGQLATQRSTNEQVKDFGQTLVKDHTQAKQQASSVASEMGLTSPSGVPADAQAEYTKLQSMQSPQFDSEFTSFMVKDHTKMIHKFMLQEKSSDPQTSKLAKAQLPVLKKHLSMAESLEHAKAS